MEEILKTLIEISPIAGIILGVVIYDIRYVRKEKDELDKQLVTERLDKESKIKEERDRADSEIAKRDEIINSLYESMREENKENFEILKAIPEVLISVNKQLEYIERIINSRKEN